MSCCTRLKCFRRGNVGSYNLPQLGNNDTNTPIGISSADNVSVSKTTSSTTVTATSASTSTTSTKNISSGTINTSISNINTAIATTNNSIATTNTSLGTADTSSTTTNTFSGTANTSSSTTNTSSATANTSSATTNISSATTNTSSATTNTSSATKSASSATTKTATKNTSTAIAVTSDNKVSSSSTTTSPPATTISTPSTPNTVDVERKEEIVERRAGVPLQSKNVEKLDDIEIISNPKDKETTEILCVAIMNNEFLKLVLDEERLKKCVDAMYEKKIKTGEYIIKEGDAGLHMYVSVEGSFEVSKGGMFIKKFSKPEAFGELAILYDTKRFASIQALSKAIVYVLDRKVYKKIMLRTAMEEQEANTNFIKNIPIFHGVDDTVLEKVGNLLKKEFFQTGKVIVRQGDRGDKFYIIKGGTVLITKRTGDMEENVGQFGKGDFFGELALLKEDCRQATVTAQAPGVECLTLDRYNFLEHWGDLEELKNYKHEKPVIENNIKELKTEYSHIKLEDLDVKETLGVGGFGRVELVQYRRDKTLTFALKYLKKIDIVVQQQQEHAYNEKLIMLNCKSDFICKLYNTYKDKKYLYFLMEVCLGGDLWTLLQKQKHRCFEEKTSKFMVACVIEAFDYLHKKNIVYRDLKPENLLLDSKGYLKLVDFGFARILAAGGKTYTFAGTPEYVAPEIILNRGHTKAVDYWALGIFIHELLHGKPPFRGSNHMKTYNMIIRGIDYVELPEKMPKTAKNLIRKLCRAIPSDRLGCQKNGMKDVRDNKWFEGFQWEQLRARKLPAPVKPKILNTADCSNFDKYPKDIDIPPDDPSQVAWDENF